MPGTTVSSTTKSSSGRRRIKLLKDRKVNDDQFMAAAIGDLEWLKHALKENRGFIDFDNNGLAPIHISSIHGRFDCLKFLVEKMKIDINLASSTGWRPIHLAISNQTGKRSIQCLEYIIQQGGDPNIANEDGVTPVHQAASEGHVHCLKALVEAGALVDAKDRRGHLPIDLAKLWGHRKCARILAAEMWHQSKEYVAMEMAHLKKVKMQQALRDLAEEEERKAEHEFYGALAFSNWLDDRKLEPKLTGPRNKEERKQLEEEKRKKELEAKRKGKKAKLQEQHAQIMEREMSRGTTDTGLLRANSMQPEMASESHAGVESSQSRRVQVASRADVIEFEDDGTMRSRANRPIFSRETTRSVLDFGLHEGSENKKKETENEEKPRGFKPHVPAYTNPVDWRKYSKLDEKEYVTNLKDCYPRDYYSSLPTHQSTPAELRLYGPEAVLYDGNGLKKLNINLDKKLRKPDLPKDVIEKHLSRNPLKLERPVVHKCKNIIDAQARKKFKLEEVMRSEGAMHLSSDVDSELFKNALQTIPSISARTNQSSRSSKSTSTLSALSETPSDASFNMERMLQSLKSLSKPTYYPDIKGETFDINFGQYVVPS